MLELAKTSKKHLISFMRVTGDCIQPYHPHKERLTP